MGVSIHANSGSASGSEGWYTVDGNDDAGSQDLARMLARNISDRLEIANLGIFPETSSRHGGLYIHHWNAPSALVETAYIQQDAELLRENQRDFARSIAQAIFTYLDQPVTCGDGSIAEGQAISLHFPGETKNNEIQIVNDGLVDWVPGQYELVNIENRYGADERYPLTEVVAPGESAVWYIPATAPVTAGIKQQVWQIQRDGHLFGAKIRVYLVVVPEEAQGLNEELEDKITEWRELGEQELDRLLAELSHDLTGWLEQEAEERLTQCMQGNALIVGALFTFAVIPQVRRKRKSQRI